MQALAGVLLAVLCTLPSAEAAPSQDARQELDLVYAEITGESLQLDAYLQPGPGPHPAVVYVHGGGFVTGDKSPCPSYILDNYLRRGYAVFSVNYRLAPQHPFLPRRTTWLPRSPTSSNTPNNGTSIPRALSLRESRRAD